MSSHLETSRAATGSSARKNTGPKPPAIVKHSGCPQWGLGLLLEERDEKRFYDFEDGQSHSIAKSFWSKLEEVQLGGEELTALEAKIRGLKAKSESARKPRVRSIAPPSTTFEEQVVRFEALFPGGFEGDVFVQDERGVEPVEAAPPSKKKPKGGRQQAIALAQQLLSKKELTSLVAAGNFAEILGRVRQVHQAAGNLLHPLGDLIPFGKVPEDHFAALAQATVDMLHGEGEFAPRFDRYVEALAQDKINTWPLATVLQALVAPDEHVFVKPSFFEKQAMILGFALGYDRLPNAAVYERMRTLGADVGERLKQKGLKPRDQMDVYAFIWRTNTAQKPVKEKPRAKAPVVGG